MADVAIRSLLQGKAIDDDVIDYLVGTVQTVVEEGDASVESLSEALRDLLISYELAADEDAAEAMCRTLHERLGSVAPAASSSAASDNAPPALLNKPFRMGDDTSKVANYLIGGIGNEEVDAFGNRQSAAARANGATRTVTLDGVKPDDDEEDGGGNGGVKFGTLRLGAPALELIRKREKEEMAAAQRAREQACELYLASKAAGGSRDVAIKSLILLSGAGKTLLDETSSLRLSQGHKYGLVGRNGTGKTTLLKAIASYELPSFPKHLKVVYVEQDPMHDLGSTPLATVLGYDLARTREPLLMASLDGLS
jgi:ABC-type multidrug transport system fused ATPase/permease subunit